MLPSLFSMPSSSTVPTQMNVYTVIESSTNFWSKWHGQSENKLTIVKDNDENQLSVTLNSYATLRKSENNECQNKSIKRVAPRLALNLLAGRQVRIPQSIPQSLAKLHWALSTTLLCLWRLFVKFWMAFHWNARYLFNSIDFQQLVL